MHTSAETDSIRHATTETPAAERGHALLLRPAGSSAFQQLMYRNLHAFGAGDFQAAYDALAEALRLALHSSVDEADLAAVAYIAGQQLRWIDLHHPTHPFSSQSALVRAQAAPFERLRRRAALRIRLVELSNAADAE